MHSEDLDERIAQSLKTLPQVKVRQDFTARVLERLDPQSHAPKSLARRRQLQWRRWAPLLAAAAVVVVAVGWTLRGARDEGQRRAKVERVAALLSERQALENELETLRGLAETSRPVLYLGADQGMDLVYDLSRLKKGDRVEIPRYLSDETQLTRLEEEVPLASWPLVAPRGMNALGMPTELFNRGDRASDGVTSTQRAIF